MACMLVKKFELVFRFCLWFFSGSGAECGGLMQIVGDVSLAYGGSNGERRPRRDGTAEGWLAGLHHGGGRPRPGAATRPAAAQDRAEEVVRRAISQRALGRGESPAGRQHRKHFLNRRAEICAGLAGLVWVPLFRAASDDCGGLGRSPEVNRALPRSTGGHHRRLGSLVRRGPQLWSGNRLLIGFP